MGIHGLSLSIRQIVQVVLALTGAAGPSKRPFVNPTLPVFWYRCVIVLGPSCSHDLGPCSRTYYTGTGQVLRGHHKIMRARQNTALYIYMYIYIYSFIGHYKTEPYRFHSLSFYRSTAISRHSLHNVDKRGYYTTPPCKHRSEPCIHKPI